ncbi:MAG: hypothetical protein J4N68_10745 [Chloroflexi bacterium]|nr:hypothetical protein [Chloroflexota bacterium]
MQKLRSLANTPMYPWIFAAYPALQLAAANLIQIDLQDIVRPLVFSWIMATIGYMGLYLVFRHPEPTALVVLFGLIFFFTYGHVYYLLRDYPVGEFTFARHRYLMVAYALGLATTIWIARKIGPRLSNTSLWLNALTLALAFIPFVRIADHLIETNETAREVSKSSRELVEDAAATDDNLPDIYYIILDTYTRGDALERDYGYDNSWFLDGLSNLGFYVATCSRSNYGETLTSLTSALNLDYIPQVGRRLAELGLDANNVFVLLKQSLVRSQLEALGYRTVAFQTGFDWSDMQDADIYLSLARKPLDLQRMSAFEALFIENTAIKLLLDTQYLLKIADFGAAGFRHRGHVELQLNILEELPRIPSIEGPTFTFAHVLIPHTPFVFEANGEIVTDPRYYSGERAGPINREYLIRGYRNEVAFVSQQMLEIAEILLRQSDVPPVIIIQGDTGLERDNKMQILNVYYAPLAAAELYPAITPVNSFRIIFNAYLGMDFDLLPDISYPKGDGEPSAPETAPNCESG